MVPLLFRGPGSESILFTLSSPQTNRLTDVRNNANIILEIILPKTKVVIYQENAEIVPFLNWFDTLPAKAQDKCRIKIERLQELGHELRRPEADLLRDGVYELRIGLQGINYRILYFFHGRAVAVLSHGLIKKQVVPKKEIDEAIRRKTTFDDDPEEHTYQEA